MKIYTANADSIGEWTDTEIAADLWNSYIAPVLLAHTDNEADEPESPVLSIGNGMAKHADEWAWDEFCSRGAGDDENICMDLADELETKLS